MMAEQVLQAIAFTLGTILVAYAAGVICHAIGAAGTDWLDDANARRGKK